MTIKYLITHSGSFHADEVCASVILQTLFPDASLIRTRDEKIFAQAGADAIIYDVGRVYDADALRFDHHMRGAREREDGTQFSSFGLIWDKFGRDYLRACDVAEDTIETVFARFDAEVVLPVDKIDTGSLSAQDIGVSAGVSLSAIISAFNPAFDDNPAKNADKAFAAAVHMTTAVIDAKRASMEADARADLIVEHCINQQWGEQILVLPYSFDFQPVLDKMDARHILVGVQPSSSGGWGVTVARKNAQSYDNVIDMPESWAGLSGAELVAASGIEGATFCHSAKFFAAAETKMAAMLMAHATIQQALDLNVTPTP